MEFLQAQTKNLAESKEDETTLSVLKELDSEESTKKLDKLVTEDLKKSGLGKELAKLMKSTNTQISTLSKSVVEKWKAIAKANEQKQQQSASSTTAATSSSSKSNVDQVVKSPQESHKSTSSPTPTTPSKSKPESIKDESNKRKESPSNGEEPSAKKAKSTSSTSLSSAPLSIERTRMVDALAKSLGTKQDGDLFEISELAEKIEEELFNHYGSMNEHYKNKWKVLAFNLKKNVDLRHAVMKKNIIVSELIGMSAQDMASDAVKKRQQQNVEGGLNARMENDKDVPETFLFKCPKCNGNRTKMVSLQIRGADEPMTNFHTCVMCGHKWTSGQ